MIPCNKLIGSKFETKLSICYNRLTVSAVVDTVAFELRPDAAAVAASELVRPTLAVLLITGVRTVRDRIAQLVDVHALLRMLALHLERWIALYRCLVMGRWK